MLWPGSSGLTVRRARICVAGLTESGYSRASVKPSGPLTVSATNPVPTPVADTGSVTAPRFLASRVSVWSPPSTLNGPSVVTAIL